MRTQTIEVNVKQKTLAIGKRKLKLEDNFEGAGTSIVKNRNDKTILELLYRKNKNFSPGSEGNRVYGFLNPQNQGEQAEVTSTVCPKEYKQEVFPTVQICGNYNVKIDNTIR